MILVLNLNASVDKKYILSDIKKGQVVRADSVQNTPGGKGLHVANVVTILGGNCLVTGFLGGKSGEFIEEQTQKYGIQCDFQKIENETRSCLAMITNDLCQTEILEPGPAISEKEQSLFIQKYDKLLSQSQIVVASGSIPRGIPQDFYSLLTKKANAQNKLFLLDTSGETLKESIKASPYFIKPNIDELRAITQRNISTEYDIIKEIKNLTGTGIKIIAISLGARGSIVGFDQHIYKLHIPKIQAVNPVGSGDSYVAGIALGLQKNLSIKNLLKFASACGTANALESESGFVNKTIVDELFNKIAIEELE